MSKTMQLPESKLCPICGKEKTAAEFGVRSDRFALNSYCQECSNEKRKQNNKKRAALLPPKPPKVGVSAETRAKISAGRSKWLAENPDKHPWRQKNTAKFKSVPCQKMKDFLTSKGIVFVEEYQPEVGGRHFSIDIAFPDKKIAIEVNGTQHYERDGKLKPYYQERHDLLESYGWQVYEVYYSMCYNLEKWEHMIPTILTAEKKIEFDYLTYVPRQKKALKCKMCGKETIGKLRFCNELCRADFKLKTLREKHGESLKIQHDAHLKICPQCSSRKAPTQKFCTKCRGVFKKANASKMPSKDELLKAVLEKPMLQVGKFYGVSGNCIKDWCQKYGIELGKRLGYWAKIAIGATHEEALFAPKEKKPPTMQKIIPLETKLSILSDYNNGHKLNKICAKYKVCKTTIYDIIKKHS